MKRATQLALTILALFTSACRDVVTATLQLASDDLAVVAAIDDGGSLRAAPLDEGGLGPFPIRDGDRALVWVMPYGSFVALDGAALPRPLARDVTVHVDDGPRAAERGDCGRCVLPSSSAPQQVAPGDSCPIPVFARVVDLVASDERGSPVEIAGSEVDPIRARIVLDWPGTCP